MPPDTPTWDVFLSYSRSADAAPASVVASALRDRGLRVFWDDHDVRPFEGISRSILHALSRSRVLLAYFSAAYPLRRACQHELTAAFLAGQQEGDPARRVLVVNPENGTDHIHPIQLRDARHVRAPRSRPELAALADAVTLHVADLRPAIGEIEPVTPTVAARTRAAATDSIRQQVSRPVGAALGTTPRRHADDSSPASCRRGARPARRR